MLLNVLVPINEKQVELKDLTIMELIEKCHKEPYDKCPLYNLDITLDEKNKLCGIVLRLHDLMNGGIE